jgi:hypothetical protein
MSSQAGAVLALYQGWSWRQLVTPARSWPRIAYQVLVIVLSLRAPTLAADLWWRTPSREANRSSR